MLSNELIDDLKCQCYFSKGFMVLVQLYLVLGLKIISGNYEVHMRAHVLGH